MGSRPSSCTDLRRAQWATAVVLGCLALLWILDLGVLQIPVLTPLKRRPALSPLSPLYAFISPELRWTALFFPLCAGFWIWRAGRLLDAQATPNRRFLLQLFGASVLLPLTLFMVREPLSGLGQLLTFYPREEVYYDALRIGSLERFYRHYVDLIPRLSRHGKHFPPGHATWLYALMQWLGDSPVIVAVAVLLVFALGMLAAHRALVTLLGERRGRQATLLCLACPALLDFACTSMDAVFFAAASLSLWLSLEAFRGERSLLWACLAGASLWVSTLLSYSALPLGLAISFHGLLRCRRQGPRPLFALAVSGAIYAGLVLLLAVVTGFDLLEHFSAARSRNLALMTAVIGRGPEELYALLAYGNAVAFSLGAGVALGTALLLRGGQNPLWRDPFALAVAGTFAVLVFGGIHQLETERIWIYTVPWLAGVALDRSPHDSRVLRWLLAVGWLQSLAMELLLFTLW